MFLKTKIVLATILLVIFGLLVTSTMNLPNNLQAKESDYNAIEYPPNIEASINGCGSIFYFRIADIWYGTIPEGYTKEIPEAPMLLPTYGYMSSTPFNNEQIGVYGKNFQGFDMPTVLRALWDGVTIIWYTPNISDENYKALEQIATKRIQSGEKLMVLPYTFKNKQIPLGRSFATSTWGVTQSCSIFNEQVYQDFLEFKDESSYSLRDKENPPIAPLDPKGNLREIMP